MPKKPQPFADDPSAEGEIDTLRRNEERLRVLVDSIEDYAIFLLDPSGRVETWNRGAARLKGWSTDEIVGKHFSIFYPIEDVAAGKCEAELDAATREGRFEEEGWRIRKDGSRFWANVVLTAVRRDGELLGFAKVTRDLTQRRVAEEERIRLAEAREALRHRDEFLSIASHELKTPLTALELQVQSLAADRTALPSPIGTKVDRIARSTARLAQLVATLLDVSRISTGRFELHPADVDLAVLAADVTDRMSDQAARAGVSLSIELPSEPLVGTWDRQALEQVLTNLLSNGLKYGGRAVRVTLARDGDTAVLEVRDRGGGIAEADLERIFGRFERASPIDHFGGLGLGLYVSRKIVAAHGGEIRASNADGGGARFVVRLPLRSATTNQDR